MLKASLLKMMFAQFLLCAVGLNLCAPSAFAQEAAALDIAEAKKAILSQAPTLPVAALEKTLNYYQQHQSMIENNQYVTIIDYTASSRTKRMYVIDLLTRHVERFLVAHGKNSGADYAKQFSNQPESYKTSPGMYLTLSTYFGEHGLSLKLKGLEKTNSNAQIRDIVLHGAEYVSDLIANTLSRLGRSLGCPAVDEKYATYIINKIKGKSLLYMYKGNTQAHL